MFSGIVQTTGVAMDVQEQEGLMRFRIDLGSHGHDLRCGASISVAGVCLTVVAIEGTYAQFEVIGETLKKTTIGTLKNGDRVNIERSCRVGDEVGGHVVSGHVMGTVQIIKLEQPINNHIITLQCPAAWMDFIFPKGFTALDGCSLTIVDVGPDWFTVHLIPETLRITTFGQKKTGDFVNLELDSMTQSIVQTVQRYLDR